MVGAADDVRDAEVEVVGDRCELVGRTSVCSQQGDAAEAERPIGVADRPTRDLGRAGSGLVDDATRTLAHRALVPRELEPAEIVQDRSLATVDGPRRVGVVDAEHEDPPVLVGEPTVRDGRQRVAEVQRPRRTGREPDANAHASIRTCPGSARHAVEPRPDRRERLEVEATLVRDVRVRVERDVGQRDRLADEEGAAVEVRFHGSERPVAGDRPLLDRRRVALRIAGVRDEEPDDRDRRLMGVLLEEHPLQHLRAVVSILRHEPGAFPEVPEDRSGLGQRPPVVENERRNAEVRIEPTEDLAAIRAVDDVEITPVVRQRQVGE